MSVEIISQGFESLELYQIYQRGYRGFVSSDDSSFWVAEGSDLKRFDLSSDNPLLITGPSLQYSLSSSITALSELSQNRMATGDDQGNITLLYSSKESKISEISVDGQITDIYNDNDESIYVSHAKSLSAIQLTNGILELSRTILLPSSITSITKTGDIVYAGTKDGLFLIDTLTDTYEDLNISTVGHVYDLQIFGTYLYVLREYELLVFDASDPRAIEQVNTRILEELGTSLLAMKVDNDVLVFITEGANGVNLINTSNPLNLSSEGYYSSISSVNAVYISSTGRWGVVVKESEVFTLEIFRRHIELEVCDTSSDPCSEELEIQVRKDFSKDIIVSEFLPTFKTDFIYSLSYSYSVLEVSGNAYQSVPEWLSSFKVDNKLFRLSGQVPDQLVESVVNFEVQAFAFKSDGEKLLTLKKLVSLSIVPKHASLGSSIPDQSLQVGEEWVFSFAESVFPDADHYESEYFIDSEWIKSYDISSIHFTPSSRQWHISYLDSTKENFFGCDPCNSTEYSTTYQFKVTAKNSASDSDPGVSTTFNLYIYSGRIPDQQTHPGISQTIVLDETIFPSGIEYAVSLLDSNGQSKDLPWWMSYISNERKILMFPSVSEIDQDFDIQIAGNNNGVELTSQFTIQVRNEAPVATKQLQNQRVKLGQSLDYSFSSDTFSDSDADSLSYTVQWQKDDGTLSTAIPSWITFTESTLTFYGSPSVQESYSLLVSASDGLGGQASTEFVVEAYNNAPSPNPDSSLQTQIDHHIGLLFSLTLPSDLFTDPDGDSLSYSALQSDGSELPSWLSFNPSTLVFSGTPSTSSLIGTSLSVQITASDGYSSSSSSFSVSISNSSPQSGSLQDQTVHIGNLFSLQLSSSLFSDPDGDALSYSALLEDGSPLPSWLIFNSLTLTLSGTPDDSDLENTSVSIKLSASDGYSSAEVLFLVSITNSGPQAGTIENQSVHIGTPYSYTLPSAMFTDEDGDSLEYTASQVDGSSLPSWLSFSPTIYHFSGTPNSSGLVNTTVNIKVSVTDGYNSTDATFSISITNSGPQAGTIENQSVHLGTLYSYTFPSSLFTDEDRDNLEYTVSQVDGSSLPSWLRFSSAVYQISGTPTSSLSENTVVNIRVSVSDGYSDAYADFSLSITNSHPVLTNSLNSQIGLSLSQGFIKFKPGVAFEYILSLNTFTDSDNDVLTYSSRLSNGDPLPEWLSFDPNTQQFFGTPPQAETLSISVTASDGYGSASDTFEMSINNKLPTLNKSLQKQFDSLYPNPFDEGFYFSFQFSADSFTDEDDTLSYSALFSENGGEWRSLEFIWVELEGRTFSGTVVSASTSNSTLSLQVTASDGQQTVSDTLSFTILSPFPSPSASTVQIESMKDTIEVEIFTNSTKLAVFSHRSLSVLDTSNNAKTHWKIEGSPSDVNYVLERLKYRPTSGRLLSESTVHLKIDGLEQEYPLSTFTPEEPIKTSSIPDQRAYIENSFSMGIQHYFDYLDESELTYSYTIEKKPEGYKDWLAFETNSFTGIPTEPEEIGSYKIRITATDQFDESASESFDLEVDYTQFQKFIITVTLISRYIGPAITALGLFTYRASIYNRVRKCKKVHAPLQLRKNENNFRSFLILRPDEEEIAYKIFKKLSNQTNLDERGFISEIEYIIKDMNNTDSTVSAKVRSTIYEESPMSSNNAFEELLKFDDAPIVKIKENKYHLRFLFFCIRDHMYKKILNRKQKKELNNLIKDFKIEMLNRNIERVTSEYESLTASKWVKCNLQNGLGHMHL